MKNVFTVSALKPLNKTLVILMNELQMNIFLSFKQKHSVLWKINSLKYKIWTNRKYQISPELDLFYFILRNCFSENINYSIETKPIQCTDTKSGNSKYYITFLYDILSHARHDIQHTHLCTNDRKNYRISPQRNVSYFTFKYGTVSTNL